MCCTVIDFPRHHHLCKRGSDDGVTEVSQSYYIIIFILFHFLMRFAAHIVLQKSERRLAKFSFFPCHNVYSSIYLSSLSIYAYTFQEVKNRNTSSFIVSCLVENSSNPRTQSGFSINNKYGIIFIYFFFIANWD